MLDVVERVEPQLSDGDWDDSVEHYYCYCSPDIGLCGTDLTDAPDHTDMDTPIEDDCVVCIDLFDSDCPRCGERL